MAELDPRLVPPDRPPLPPSPPGIGDPPRPTGPMGPYRKPPRPNRRLTVACAVLAASTVVFFFAWRHEVKNSQDLIERQEQLAEAPSGPRPTVTLPDLTVPDTTVDRDVTTTDLPPEPAPDPTTTEPPTTTIVDAHPEPGAFPYELTVHTDGCGVIRTQLPDETDLGWSVEDEDGFQVLDRNALGETRYRYFVGGTYTVRLTQWHGESYVPVSNTVTIHC